jgi:hypothetical protein
MKYVQNLLSRERSESDVKEQVKVTRDRNELIYNTTAATRIYR